MGWMENATASRYCRADVKWINGMLSAHITSFLKLINIQLEETSRGAASSHHFHNVQCGIENILSLLEHNNDLVDKADQLSRRASNYITRHDMISSKISERDISEDADRLRATYEALAGFRFAVEHRSTEHQGSHTRTGLTSLSTNTSVTKSRSLSVPRCDPARKMQQRPWPNNLRGEHRPTTTSRQR